MKKLLAGIAAAALMTSAALAQDITLGLSVDQLFESRVGVNDAIKAEAADRGYGLIEVVADGDAQAQNAQIQSLITQGVDAILVCAVDQNTIERALIAAKRAGIPVVAYDRDLPDSQVVAAFVGPDSLIDGRLAGEYMANALKDRAGEIVLVELIGALNDQNGIDRSAGWREEIAKLDNVKIIEVPTDWDSSRALSGTQNAFQANPDIDGVFAATDTHFPAVETVLTDMGKLGGEGDDRVILTGINGSGDGYAAVTGGTADAFVVMNLDQTGRTAVALAADLIAGKEVPRVNVIGGAIYDAAGAEANKASIWGAK
ncbi:sugar ABC transporter substrate-binding protein [Jannaschia sp. M317]|uniref:sugar ABC transporter substrate-binding protein n=1 Tax=Jannaschia sp. M317 TaxID=2867011 RepID=UPI0021A4A346|nr:sugar ABC transporter substrate-binding protein [Jannaschia sp. M317]UWQ19904.1 sugar ABC transporter substrate-binding protein [Jannaschia sp. M317]